LLLSGCTGYGYYGYHHRYYGPGYYGGGGVAYTTPPPPQGQVVVQGQVGAPPPATGVVITGEGIAGSDGTRGWRVGSQAPEQDFQRLIQLTARAQCQVEASTQVELKAVCMGNVHLIVRFDQQNVYKLCGPNTDPNVCNQTWTTIGN